MFDIDGIWTSDKKLKIMTGLNIKESGLIFKDFSEELIKIRRSEKTYLGVGRPSKLDSREIFLMVLIFIRHYPTYEFLSVIFNIDVSNVKRWIESSYMALGNVLIKKNFAHLIVMDQKKLQESDLNNSERSILTELNNLSEDPKIM